MQNLVQRGSLVIVEPVAQAVDEPVDTEELKRAAEAVEEEISESEVTSTEDEPSAAPSRRPLKSSSSRQKTTRS